MSRVAPRKTPRPLPAPGAAWPAPAKLNLFLHVTGRRADDGYHELQTIFQFLDYGDVLNIAPRGDGAIRRLQDVPGVSEQNDLTLRAARALASASGVPIGADIRVTKRIPLGSGLGGGSSDAATTLVALNRIWNLGFTVDELASVGLRLGADVPVFVRGIASWAGGIGERLTPLPDLPRPWYLVLVPPVAVNTRDIFAAPELRRDCPPVTVEDFLQGRTGNVCEEVTRARFPVVGEALDWLSRFGRARMSGTGASVFAAFEQAEAAQAALDQLPEKTWFGFVARGLNQSPLRHLS